MHIGTRLGHLQPEAFGVWSPTAYIFTCRGRKGKEKGTLYNDKTVVSKVSFKSQESESPVSALQQPLQCCGVGAVAGIQAQEIRRGGGREANCALIMATAQTQFS